MIGSASDMFQIGDGHSGYFGLEGDGAAGHLALGKKGFLLTAWFQISILEINPSDPIEKGGRRDAKL
jgi:hypothetical protein